MSRSHGTEGEQAASNGDPEEVQYLFREPGRRDDEREDNAVDPRVFLKRMRIENPPARALATLFVDTLVVHRQIALVLLDFLVFLLHKDERVTAKGMFGIELHFFAMFYVLLICVVALVARSRSKDARRVEQGALCMLLLATFSPLLRTLTEAYSSDTVYTLVSLCGVVHLYLYDYQPDVDALRFNSAVSLNAGFLMSLLLASRLETSEAVASFLLCSILLLALVPMGTARASFARHGVIAVLMNVSLFLAVQYGLHLVERSGLAVAYSVVTFMVCVVCPFLLWILQTRKHVVRGPWDVAKVDQVELD
ncbi:Phosphatidylinositol N-acetylglucosaminyltransferase subunit C [Hondaea fermentalgiana]|uniref:Phosphatidylinositol N-acetylglucosaminyltransferase subunit C n=1 Tax=Hondaea fermentalgiana TaxID=2315210 RepID=A0A2R5GUE6_9STRA|nr:Phosphatidylinositol N-acetylglucosaminyltransferase subunit C [Hondaea fermentalgiana]|eukprot:GBG34470.1 Phosphatidylinositol N-acetylglucosaminyltransferase subunit C [Hondaea fermentalgiana]